MERRFDVAIIGAGPAGLATALHLQQRAPALAARTLIIEAAEHPRRKLCGGGVTFHGEHQLAALGITADVPAVHIEELHFRLGTHSFSTHCANAMRVIQRAEFDAALADTSRHRGLQIRSNERLLDLTISDQGVELRTSHDHYLVRAVVGADGTKSTVRRQLGLRGTTGVARLLHAMTPSTPLEARAAPVARFDFSCVMAGVQGYTWDFPCLIEGEHFVNRGIFDSRIAANGAPERGRLKQSFLEGLAAQGVPESEIRLEGHPVRWFRPDTDFSRPRVLLVGDAAGVDPLFAEGISYGMEYGALAAEMLQEAFHRNDFSFSEYRQRILDRPLGRSLLRRTRIARGLYSYERPLDWALLWRLAAIAPAIVKRAIGSALGVLPPLRLQA